jgi:hypothetical protein
MFAAYNALEWGFISALVAMIILVGLFSLVVVARVVEPRGVRVLLRKIIGR